MFKAKISDVGLLRDSLASVAELISEGTFKIKKDGIYFTATDPTMVTLVDLKLLSPIFDEYKADGAEEISLNLDSLLAVLKRAKPDEVVTIALDTESNKLAITLEGASTRSFTVPLIDIEEGDAPEMNLEFSAELEVKTEVLDDGIGDASVIADTIVLGADKDHFTMSAKGDLSHSELKLDRKSKSVIGIKAKDPVQSKYSLEYFKKIAKGGKLTDSVKVELGKDYPVRLTFQKKDKFSLSFVLAPRVED